MLEHLSQVRVAAAREVRADVRRAAGAERADRVGRRAARDLLVAQLLLRRVRREHALHQVPHALGALAAADADLPAHPHQVQHAGDVARVRPAAGLPRDVRAVLDVARAQRALLRPAARGCARGSRPRSPTTAPSACASPSAGASGGGGSAGPRESTKLASCAQYSNRSRSRRRPPANSVSSNAPWREKSTSRWLRATTAVGSSCRQRRARAVSSRSCAVGLALGSGPASRWLRIASRRIAAGVVRSTRREATDGVGRDRPRRCGRRRCPRRTRRARGSSVADRRVEHQRAQRVGDRRHGLVVGDPGEAVGHRVRGHEGAARRTARRRPRT